MRGTYHYWRTRQRHSKHSRKSKEDQFNGKVATDTHTVRRTAEIEWRRRKMGWSSATGEGKTAVAPLNLTGGMYSVRAEGPAWKPPRWGGNVGVLSQARLSFSCWAAKWVLLWTKEKDGIKEAPAESHWIFRTKPVCWLGIFPLELI